MSHRIVHNIAPSYWKEICIEGNELVCYEYRVDPDKPKTWRDGCEYRFNKELVSVKRVGSKQLAEIFN